MLALIVGAGWAVSKFGEWLMAAPSADGGTDVGADSAGADLSGPVGSFNCGPSAAGMLPRFGAAANVGCAGISGVGADGTARELGSGIAIGTNSLRGGGGKGVARSCAPVALGGRMGALAAASLDGESSTIRGPDALGDARCDC